MATDDVHYRNEVLLVGRVTTVAEVRTLPSGDEVTVWRVTINRPPPTAASPPRRADADPDADAGRDTVDCATWSVRVRRSALTWGKGDVVELSGSLRRRFWSSPFGGRQSAYTVDVVRARRISPARQRTSG